jgi:outer membrane protein OmpA-like peptidoglycan-associated protein
LLLVHTIDFYDDSIDWRGIEKVAFFYESYYWPVQEVLRSWFVFSNKLHPVTFSNLIYPRCMFRTILILLSLSLHFIASGQHNKTDTSLSKLAKVNVFVTDMLGQPTKGEQLLFKSDVTQKIFGGLSDAKGKFSLQLPSGSGYMITVKSLTDTTKYGMINIPALKPDEFFTEPFKVNVKFEAARSYTLENVHFDFGKATLRPESSVELEELVRYMKNKDAIKIEIAGHTDNVGNDADNVKLSQQRAEAIRNYLIKKGIQSGRVMAKGYGASQPVSDNDTDEGRQLNRRTEVHVL